MDAHLARRNVLVLAGCQALLMIGTSTLIAEAALVGYTLAANKALATLPVGVQQAATMATTIPASLLMRRIGRRAGFGIGAACGIVGTAIATVAILWGSFWLFCLGTALGGIYSGFGNYYRFAAVDGASGPWKAKAISYVLAGGVIAALLGPELAKLTKDMFAPIEFAGSFAALTVVAMLALALVQAVSIPPPSAAERAEGGRPILEILRQPACLVAVFGSMIGYGGMSLVMAATPLAMVACGHPFESAAFVIQWHVFAMFAPSFVTGRIVSRFGVLPVMAAGAVLLALSLGVNLSGVAVWQFWSGLVVLGLAWNLLFVGGTSLLTECYTPAERAKVQAANDFLVFGTVTIAATFSGVLHSAWGWEALNYLVMPFALAALAAPLWLTVRRRPALAR